MFRRKLIITAVILLINLLVSLQHSYASSKSVYVISSQNYSTVKPYSIDANHVTLQSTAGLPREGTGGAIALAAWPQKELLFATYDYTIGSSAVITWVSTKNLVNAGRFDTGIVTSYAYNGSYVKE